MRFCSALLYFTVVFFECCLDNDLMAEMNKRERHTEEECEHWVLLSFFSAVSKKLSRLQKKHRGHTGCRCLVSLREALTRISTMESACNRQF